jgi:hypothetical protein
MKIGVGFIAGALTFVSGCSDPGPDGYVYTVRGAGNAVPVAGQEITVLPYQTEADLFYEPIQQAQLFATDRLEEALVPSCDEGNEFLSSGLAEIETVETEINERANIPIAGCTSICTEKIDAATELATANNSHETGIRGFNARIEELSDSKKPLAARRKQKLGSLQKEYSSLNATRNQIVNTRAGSLERGVLDQLRISVVIRDYGYCDIIGSSSYRVSNDTKFALPARASIQIEGFKDGEKILAGSIAISGEKRDQYGFGKGYAVGPSETFTDGAYGQPELPKVNSPTMRLMIEQKGWAGVKCGYNGPDAILPDRIVVTGISRGAFVIPAEGIRKGSDITYTPIKVDFREVADTEAFPQDQRLASLTKQISNLHLPEDDQLEQIDDEIDDLRDQIADKIDQHSRNPLVKNLAMLKEQESNCRSDRDSLAEVTVVKNEVLAIQQNLASCSSEAPDTSLIYASISQINASFNSEIFLPNIDEKYVAHATVAVLERIVDANNVKSSTGIDGGFSLSVENSLLYANTKNSFSEGFWLVAGNELNGRYKNLDQNTMKTGNVVDYIDSIIQYGCRSCSLEEFKESLSESASNELEDTLTYARSRLQEMTSEFNGNENSKLQEIETTVARIESVQCN